MTKKSIFHYALSSLLVGGIALSVTSCADDDINPNQGNDGDALVRFSINDVQEQAVSRGLEMTRGAIANGITAADLAGHKLAAHSNRNIDVCLIETTVEGVNPIKADAHTRARIATAISGDFSSTGIRGVAENSILSTPEWFKAVKTKQNGELYTPIRWSIAQPWARFFAVYPSKDSYSKLTINDMASADNAPSVDFTVEPNVNDQKDFMTACTGKVNYATQGVQPTTSLDFRHALTAIRFAVGQNLSWNKTIDKVEIRNAIMKSKYKLSSEFNGTGADWDNTGATRGTATLSGVSVSTSRNPNVTIMGTTGDNYTFYMIPQVLTGHVTAYVHCTDGTTITVPLKGEWKAGTTRTYKLSQTNSNWNYMLNSTNPSRAANYDETASQAYTITSYRENSGTRQAVPWKVIGYDADDDGNFSMSEKPNWLTSLEKPEGAGAPYAAEACKAFIAKATMIDFLKPRNDGLKNATPLGTSAVPYDLSTKGGSTSRSTANCYVISAPGFYRIPLVYGNAITKGNDNTRSYKTTNTGTYILSNFKDHLGNDITNPWIEKTNNNANAGIDGAKIIWADEANLVNLATGSSAITHDATGNAFLEFKVTAANITSGNAVVAVTKGGTVVWSWHLWFAPQSALTPIEVTNLQNVKYNFTTETVGWKPTKWKETTYQKPRTVKVRIEQTIANNGIKQHTDVVITQNPGIERTGITTLYQFGRKDAFPGTDIVFPAKSPASWSGGSNMSIINGIQNPDKFYNDNGNSWRSAPPTGYTYYNVWSADNTTTSLNDNEVIKTIYDPSPAGFKMPANNAFTGFTTTGQNYANPEQINADGTAGYSNFNFNANYGHNFWTNSNKSDIIFFPASGDRDYNTYPLLEYIGTVGYYWMAVPLGTDRGSNLSFDYSRVNPVYNFARAYGFAVRPVTE